jgi:hypothetical protein
MTETPNVYDYPLVSEDVNGARIVRVSDHLFKMVEGGIVTAPVPENLGMPSAWTVADSASPYYPKARSMLGLT